MNAEVRVRVPDAELMEALGAGLARAARAATGVRVYLRGDLGTGKTTFVRGFLRAAGYQGPVRSPTYTLIEPYSLPGGEVFHLDLYRLAAAEELEYLGLRDLAQPGSTLLVEWPQQGQGALPPADLELRLVYDGTERLVGLQACTPTGERLLRQWQIPASCQVLD